MSAAPTPLCIALERPVEDIERARRALDAPILSTPTGPAREKLTEANIHLMRAAELLLQVRKEGAASEPSARKSVVHGCNDVTCTFCHPPQPR